MSFRNDHDAALARAEALETQVERERDRAANAERERDRLREELVAARSNRRPPAAPASSDRVEVAAVDEPEWEMISMISIMVALFAFVVILASVR